MSTSPQRLGAVLSFTQISYGLEIKCENGLLRIQLIGETVRFWATQFAFGDDRSYSVVDKPRTSPNFVVQDDDSSLLITAEGHLKIEVRRSDSVLNVWDADDNALLVEGQIQFTEQKALVSSKLHHADAIYGGGLRNGTINQRTRHLEFWNSNDPAPEMKERRSMYTCIPFMTMHRPGLAYGIFYDTVARADLACGHNSCGSDNLQFDSIGPDAKFYLIPGPSPAKILDRYTDLTGRIELSPLWALHFGHSRYGIDTWEQLQHRVVCYLGRGMSISVVYLDLDYMVGNRPWTWNEDTFGKIEWLLKWLKTKNIHVVLIVDPLIPEVPDYPPYQQLLEIDGFCHTPDGTQAKLIGYAGPSGLPDLFRHDVYQLVLSWFHRWSELYGISFWLDKTEPALCAEQTEEAHRVGLDNDTLAEDAVVHRIGDSTVSHAQLHNAYGLRFAMGAHGGQLKARPNKRPFVLTRSGCAGSQRFGWTWTGDNYSDEGSLTNGIRQLLTMGLSGWPLTGTNIGGFFGTCNGPLWARWMQLGAFSPLFWSHSIDPRKVKPDAEPIDQTPWLYGDAVRAISRNCLELRVRLLPHTNDLMWRAMLKGEPLMRPMFFDCWENPLPQYDWIDLQYRWGDFLVAPIVKINDTGRQVFLPGADTPRGAAIWYDFFTGIAYGSGDNIYIDAPLERFPLLVRAGGIIPMWDFALHADGEQETPVINVYSGGPGKYTHYMDDGESLNYQQQKTAKLVFDYSGDRRSGKLTITLEDGDSCYESILVRLRMIDLPASVTLNGAPVHFFEYRPEHGGSVDVMLSARALMKGSTVEYQAK